MHYVLATDAVDFDRDLRMSEILERNVELPIGRPDQIVRCDRTMRAQVSFREKPHRVVSSIEWTYGNKSPNSR